MSLGMKVVPRDICPPARNRSGVGLESVEVVSTLFGTWTPDFVGGASLNLRYLVLVLCAHGAQRVREIRMESNTFGAREGENIQYSHIHSTGTCSLL